MHNPLITNIVIRDDAKQALPNALREEVLMYCKKSPHLEFNIVPEQAPGLELFLIVGDPLVALIIDTGASVVIAKSVHGCCCYYEDLDNIDQLLIKLKEDFNRAT